MKRYIFVLSIVLSAITTSCADLLEQEPANAITTEQIKKILESGDEDQVDIILGGMANNLPYAIHRTLGYGGSGNDARVNSPLRLHYYNSLVGYDIVCGAGVSGFGSDAYLSYTSRESAGSTHNYCFWYFGWSCVVSANKLLQYLPETLNSSKLKDYKARALTLRAYGYNFLMENYRDAYNPAGEGLMIYDRIDPSGTYKPLTSAKETYDFIKQDLAEAVRLFAESEIGDNKDGYTADTKDIDLGVANFVLARVSLLTGDYAAAISACNAILPKYPDLITADNYGGKNTGTAAEPEFKAEANALIKFGTINPEVIFGFEGVSTFQNVVYEWLNTFGTGYGGASSNWGRIVSALYDAINANDVRKSLFLDGSTTFDNYAYPTSPVTIRTIPTYSNLKFAATEVGGKKEPTDLANLDVCYMRTSEVLLMKAEAQAQNGDENGAKATLNTLLAARTKTGETALTCDSYGGASTALDMVKLQWRIEMWGENGLEYYNNKRWGITVTRKSNVTNHWDEATITPSQMKWAFPTDESIYNPNLQ
ncbi:MAG: RagB/SusD family nutrient uptake outer membrane protein [Tannerella sp.]|jgi:hypothetical protein|nr:RagB/SusD family nutrient uptake outer membrane protein [Tannerella sp.]